MATIAAGNHVEVYVPLAGGLFITPGTGGYVDFGCSSPSGETAPEGRRMYAAASIDVPAGSTVFLRAEGEDATYTEPPTAGGTVTSYTAAQLSALAAASGLTTHATYVASDTGARYFADSASSLVQEGIATYSSSEIERLAGVPSLSGLALLMSATNYPREFTLAHHNIGEVTQAAATWTSLSASDDGGLLRLSSAGVHGLATTGRKVPLTFASGMSSGLYTISSIPNTTDIIFTQAYTAVTTPASVLAGSEATIWTMTLPANAFGTYGVLSVVGSVASTGSTNNKQFRLLLGGTAVVAQTNVSAVADVISRFEWRVANMGATNVQQNSVHRLGTAATVAAITGTGSKDTTTALTLAMTCTMATANEFINPFGMLVRLAPSN